ncbi:DUF1456 family protein [Rhodohalobacter mucosus]|uniref:DUF1456 domain-containing protein n=1 Tax=Rhodohalobacter mucosus TaxID=2079485 RepID=A0A316U0M3_9BACT|nr:DUF1456 family protein [Rhodohalobacter mucosus]PWN06266.1 DUF1456 domain-containing protein [Rhodohalobacter mucosus]
MRNNDILKSLRYILDINEAEMAQILKLAGYQPKRSEIEYIFEEHDDEAPDTTHELTAHFLDGVIFHKRGKSDKHPPQPIRYPVTNNMVLKKLRVAFKLREDDILELLKRTGFKISSTELSAFFRKENQKNYRPAGDQVLRYFLRGLAERERGS